MVWETEVAGNVRLEVEKGSLEPRYFTSLFFDLKNRKQRGQELVACRQFLSFFL